MSDIVGTGRVYQIFKKSSVGSGTVGRGLDSIDTWSIRQTSAEPIAGHIKVARGSADGPAGRVESQFLQFSMIRWVQAKKETHGHII